MVGGGALRGGQLPCPLPFHPGCPVRKHSCVAPQRCTSRQGGERVYVGWVGGRGMFISCRNKGGKVARIWKLPQHAQAAHHEHCIPALRVLHEPVRQHARLCKRGGRAQPAVLSVKAHQAHAATRRLEQQPHHRAAHGSRGGAGRRRGSYVSAVLHHQACAACARQHKHRHPLLLLGHTIQLRAAWADAPGMTPSSALP